MAAADLLIGEIQSLLDSGHTPTRTANMLGLDHKQVRRAIEKHNLEIYVAYDEEDDKKHLYQNFEWLWEEDKLEEITASVIRDGSYTMRKSRERDEDDYKVGNYCNNVYGDFKTYLYKKGFSIISDSIFIECTLCGKEKSIDNYEIHRGRLFGLDNRCKKCMCKMKSKWAIDHRDKTSAAAQRRRARLKNLRDDFYEEDVKSLIEIFEGGCALTGDYEIHFDHVIPLATGHGGTYSGNMIPLRSDLNFSKNDSNIFEWFEANRQRFELSLERFDKLIAWLASANAMTVEEYRDYVYWCHANPRTIDELTDGREAK